MKKLHLNQFSDNAQEICNLFADFFQGVYTTFDEKDRDRDYFSFFPEFSDNISVFQLSEDEILRALHNLNSAKGPGPDGIAPVFLKNLAEELAPPLQLHFNICISEIREISGYMEVIAFSAYL